MPISGSVEQHPVVVSGAVAAGGSSVGAVVVGTVLTSGTVALRPSLSGVIGVEASAVAGGLGWFIVTQFGAVADGVTDDTAAIQDAIDAAAAQGRGIVYFPAGIYVVDSGLTVSPGAMIVLQGSGKGATGGWVGTRLKRNSGTTPIISVVGTSQLSSDRPICEIRDMELSGNNTSGDLLVVYRASHFGLRDVRVANNQGGTGVHFTEVWDSTLNNVWVERCGSGTSKPAMLLDSVIGAGADANCATIQIANITFQSNYGTDWRFSGSSADSSPCNDIEVVNTKMEGCGAGTLGSPDTYPYIDLDYAQHCYFTNTRISQPTGRASTFIQQVNVSAGPRANMFCNTVLDVAGSNAPERYIDQASGGLVFHGMGWPAGNPTVEYVRVQTSVARGRFRANAITHNSANVSSGFVTDIRATSEEVNKGRHPVPIVSSTGSLTTVGDSAVWALADAADQFVLGQVILPRDVDSFGKAYIRVHWVASTTGDVRWSWYQSSLAEGDDLSAAGTQVDQTVASPGANLLKVSSWAGTSGIDAAPGELVTVKVGRKGTHVADTLAGTVYVVAVEVYYDKRI